MHRIAWNDADPPADDQLIPVHRSGGFALFAWPTRAGRLCWGEIAVATVTSGCVAAKDLPTGPEQRTLHGPVLVTDSEALTVLFADREQLTAASCNGTRFALTEVGRTPLADGVRRYYALVTPWVPYGDVPLEVRRPEGAAVERMWTETSDWVPHDDPRYRKCG
ncbi:hypothetical protein [Kitasatospora sp. NPDC088134]|uniref:hypothetical protein n=1 Tax=Kitasatospora sp. NPDC088134 TaxID=3364071 RepID=UPI00382F8032